MRLFQVVEQFRTNDILRAITDEHPQIIAVVMSNMSAKKAAQIIYGLPPERQLTVLRRMAVMQPISVAIVEVIARVLHYKICTHDYERVGGLHKTAQCLEALEQTTRNNILENLGQADPELVDDLKAEMKLVHALKMLVKQNKIEIRSGELINE
jgi:flagellar motor switch protein FliG